VRDLDSHTMRLGKIWFVVAGTFAIALVTALFKTDRFLDAAGFREKSGALLRTVRTAQANLPSSASSDPRTLVVSKVTGLGAARDTHSNHAAISHHSDAVLDADASAPVAELVTKTTQLADAPATGTDTSATDMAVPPVELPPVHQ
jgi:hypothetical protein